MLLEISGIEPETKICKINVFPIKPYPLKTLFITNKYKQIF